MRVVSNQALRHSQLSRSRDRMTKTRVEDAADRLKHAAIHIDEAHAKPAMLEHLQERLGALTDYSLAEV
jgi:hypothetical protein